MTDSFQVSSSTQPSAYNLEFAKATKKKHAVETEDTDQTTGSAFDDGMGFIQVYTGYDFSFLEDVVNGSNGWVQFGKSLGDATTGGGNNSGILAGAQFGLHLDPSNSLALDLGSVFTFGNNWTISTGGNTATQNLSPLLLSASLDYILDIVKQPGSHTYLTVGAGYYHTSVSDDVTGTGITYNGTFTGDTIGGTLAVGEEVALGSSVGLDFSVRGRYASFNKVSSSNANAINGTGPSSLAMFTPTPNTTVIVPVTDAGIAGGLARDAVVDYSGIDAKVALDIYFN
jgi:hypothetical protein